MTVFTINRKSQYDSQCNNPNGRAKSMTMTVEAQKRSVDSELTTILFDIGNVLATDFWEALWLSPETGLADKLAVPVDIASQIGSHLWSRFSIAESEEADYWTEFEKLLGSRIPPELICYSERANVKANPHARERLLSLRAHNINLGIISNNTSFWAPRQLKMAGVQDLLDVSLMFLSSSFEVEKAKGNPDLFKIASTHVIESRTIVVDDRMENINAAKALKFRAYLFGDGISAGVTSSGYYLANDFQNLDLTPPELRK